MDWRAFAKHGAERGPEFYRTALTYGHYLWQRGLAARAVLCLDRAFGADVVDGAPVLAEWPWPYAAMAWFLRHTPPDVFLGNPRVHFQHYADRLGPPRQAQRRARAWACWALTRAVLPHLPRDPRHDVREPTESEIAAELVAHGGTGEAALWSAVLAEQLAAGPTYRPVE